jgi:hypothetical protein
MGENAYFRNLVQFARCVFGTVFIRSDSASEKNNETIEK